MTGGVITHSGFFFAATIVTHGVVTTRVCVAAWVVHISVVAGVFHAWVVHVVAAWILILRMSGS